MLGRAEAGDDARRAAELLGEVRERRDADPADDEKWSLHVEPVAVSERAEDRNLVASFERGDRLCARTDHVDEKRHSPGGATQTENGRGRSVLAPRA